MEDTLCWDTSPGWRKWWGSWWRYRCNFCCSQVWCFCLSSILLFTKAYTYEVRIVFSSVVNTRLSVDGGTNLCLYLAAFFCLSFSIHFSPLSSFPSSPLSYLPPSLFVSWYTLLSQNICMTFLAPLIEFDRREPLQYWFCGVHIRQLFLQIATPTATMETRSIDRRPLAARISSFHFLFPQEMEIAKLIIGTPPTVLVGWFWFFYHVN